MFKRKQPEQQHCEVCVEVRKLIETVEKHKNWAVGNDIPLALRLKSLLQSLLDLEAQFEVEKKEFIRKDGENEKSKGLLLFEFEQLKEVHWKITAELEKYKTQLEELIQEKKELEEKLRRVREKIVDAEKQLLDEVEEVLVMSHPGQEKKTLSQYEREIQEEADRLFISGQVSIPLHSEISEYSGSAGVRQGEPQNFDYEANVQQNEVRSTGSQKSPDEAGEKNQKLNRSADFAPMEFETTSVKSEGKKKSESSQSKSSKSSKSRKNVSQSQSKHKQTDSPKSVKSGKENHDDSLGNLIQHLGSATHGHSEAEELVEHEFDTEFHDLGAYTDNQFDEKMIFSQATGVVDDSLHVGDKSSASEDREPSFEKNSAAIVSDEVQVDDPNEKVAENGNQDKPTEVDQNLALEVNNKETQQTQDESEQGTERSESQIDEDGPKDEDVPKDEDGPEDESSNVNIDLTIQDAVQSPPEEEPTASQEQVSNDLDSAQTSEFEIPEFVMIDGFRVQYSEVEHHLDSQGRMLLPSGEYFQVLEKKNTTQTLSREDDTVQRNQTEDQTNLTMQSDQQEDGFEIEIQTEVSTRVENSSENDPNEQQAMPLNSKQKNDKFCEPEEVTESLTVEIESEKQPNTTEDLETETAGVSIEFGEGVLSQGTKIESPTSLSENTKITEVDVPEVANHTDEVDLSYENGLVQAGAENDRDVELSNHLETEVIATDYKEENQKTQSHQNSDNEMNSDAKLSVSDVKLEDSQTQDSCELSTERVDQKQEIFTQEAKAEEVFSHAQLEQERVETTSKNEDSEVAQLSIAVQDNESVEKYSKKSSANSYKSVKSHHSQKKSAPKTSSSEEEDVEMPSLADQLGEDMDINFHVDSDREPDFDPNSGYASRRSRSHSQRSIDPKNLDDEQGSFNQTGGQQDQKNSFEDLPETSRDSDQEKNIKDLSVEETNDVQEFIQQQQVSDSLSQESAQQQNDVTAENGEQLEDQVKLDGFAKTPKSETQESNEIPRTVSGGDLLIELETNAVDIQEDDASGKERLESENELENSQKSDKKSDQKSHSPQQEDADDVQDKFKDDVLLNNSLDSQSKNASESIEQSVTAPGTNQEPEEFMVLSPDGHILTTEEIQRVKMRLKKKKDLNSNSLTDSDAQVVDGDDELTPEEEEYYTTLFESLELISQSQDVQQLTFTEQTLEDKSVHLVQGTQDTEIETQETETKDGLKIELEIQEQASEVEGKTSTQLASGDVLDKDSSELPEAKERDGDESNDPLEDAKFSEKSEPSFDEASQEDHTIGELTNDKNENSIIDQNEDEIKVVEDLKVSETQDSQEKVEAQITTETSDIDEKFEDRQEIEKLSNSNEEENNINLDKTHVGSVSEEKPDILHADQDAKSEKTELETNATLEGKNEPEPELVSENKEPGVTTEAQDSSVTTEVQESELAPEVQNPEPEPEEEQEEELPEDFIEMLKTANLTLNKSDQELFEETHSEIRVALVTYHFFLSSTHYIQLAQKIIKGQIFYCYTNLQGDTCCINQLEYANIVKTVIYWKQLISAPGTSIDQLIDQNLRQHKYQSLNIDKYYSVLSADGELVNLMTKITGATVEYFYYDSNGQKTTVAENHLMTNDRNIINQHKLYPKRIQSLSPCRYFAVDSDMVWRMLTVEREGKRDVYFSYYVTPQEKNGQINRVSLSAEELAKKQLSKLEIKSGNETGLQAGEFKTIWNQKLPTKVIFVKCPQTKSKHVVTPSLTDKSLTYTYVNSNCEIVKFTHEEVEREKFALEYLTLDLDASCQKFDSNKSYTILSSLGEPRKVFTDIETIGDGIYSLDYYFIGQNGDKVEVEYDRLQTEDLNLPESIFDGTLDASKYFAEKNNTGLKLNYSTALDDVSVDLLSKFLAGNFEIVRDRAGISCGIGYQIILSNGKSQLLSCEETQALNPSGGNPTTMKNYFYISDVGNKVSFPEPDINTSQFRKILILPGSDKPLELFDDAIVQPQKEFQAVVLKDTSKPRVADIDFYLQVDSSDWVLQLKNLKHVPTEDEDRIIFYDYSAGTRFELRRNFAFGREELFYLTQDSQKIVVDPQRLQPRQEIIYYDKDGKKIDPEGDSFQAKQKAEKDDQASESQSQKSSKYSKSITEEQSNIKDPDVTSKVLYENYSTGQSQELTLEYILGERYLYYFDESGTKIKVNWSEEENRTDVKFTYINAFGDQSSRPFEEIARDRMREEDERLMQEMLDAENEESEIEEEMEEEAEEEEAEYEGSDQEASESAHGLQEPKAKNIDFNISRIIMYNYVTGDRIELEHQYIQGKLVLFFRDHKGKIVVVDKEKLEPDSQQISYYSEEGDMLGDAPAPSEEVLASSLEVQMFAEYTVYNQVQAPASKPEQSQPQTKPPVESLSYKAGTIPEIEDYEAGPQLTKVIFCDYETFKRIELGFMYIQGKLVLFEEDPDTKIKKEVLQGEEEDDDQKQFTFYTEDGYFDSKPPRPSKEILLDSFKIFELNPAQAESSSPSLVAPLTEAQKKVAREFDHQREYAVTEHPALVNPDYVPEAKLTKIMFMDYDSCENYSLMHRYVQGRIRLFRVDEETDAGIEVEWDRTNENLQFTFYTEDGDFKEFPPLPSKEVIEESYRRLKLFEKDGPAEPSQKPKKKIIKKVVKKTSKQTPDEAGESSAQSNGIKSETVENSQQLPQSSAPKKTVKRVVKRVVKKDPEAQTPTDLKDSKENPETANPPEGEKKTTKKIIKKVIKKKQAVDAITTPVNSTEQPVEGDEEKSPAKKKVVRVVKKVAKPKPQEVDDKKDVDLTLDTTSPTSEFWQEGTIEAAAKKKKIVKKIVKKKAADTTTPEDDATSKTDTQVIQSDLQAQDTQDGLVDPEAKPAKKKIVKKIVKKKPAATGEENEITENTAEESNQEGLEEGQTKSGSTRVVTDVTKLKMKIKKKKPADQEQSKPKPNLK